MVKIVDGGYSRPPDGTTQVFYNDEDEDDNDDSSTVSSSPSTGSGCLPVMVAMIMTGIGSIITLVSLVIS